MSGKGRRARFYAPLDRGAPAGRQQHGHRQRGVEVGQEEGVADQVAPDEGVRLVDPPDPQRRRSGAGELHGHPVADRQVVGVGGGRVDEQLPVGQGGLAARRHVQNEGRGEVAGGDGGEVRHCLAELELALIDGRGRRDPGDRGRGHRHRIAEGPRAGGCGRRDDHVGGDGLVHAGGGRLGQRRPEHGDGRDQGQTDHQGRRRLGRPPGAAHRVLPTQLARHAEGPGQGASDDARERAGHRRGQHGHADEEGHRAQPHRAGWPAR